MPYLAPKGTYSWMEYIFVLKGTDLDAAQKLLNFMLEPDAAIAVSKGMNYPPSLDPTKVKMPPEIQKLPAFDPTGKLDGYLFAKPDYWNSHQVEWAEKWDRITLVDGSRIEGSYISGDDRMVMFEVGNAILEIPFSEIKELSFSQ